MKATGDEVEEEEEEEEDADREEIAGDAEHDDHSAHNRSDNAGPGEVSVSTVVAIGEEEERGVAGDDGSVAEAASDGDDDDDDDDTVHGRRAREEEGADDEADAICECSTGVAAAATVSPSSQNDDISTLT